MRYPDRRSSTISCVAERRPDFGAGSFRTWVGAVDAASVPAWSRRAVQFLKHANGWARAHYAGCDSRTSLRLASMPFKNQAQRRNFAQLLVEERSPIRPSRSGIEKRERNSYRNGWDRSRRDRERRSRRESEEQGRSDVGSCADVGMKFCKGRASSCLGCRGWVRSLGQPPTLD
jgi:hypothetical protein